jgi:hypothetical protein
VGNDIELLLTISQKLGCSAELPDGSASVAALDQAHPGYRRHVGCRTPGDSARRRTAFSVCFLVRSECRRVAFLIVGDYDKLTPPEPGPSPLIQYPRRPRRWPLLQGADPAPLRSAAANAQRLQINDRRWR